MTDDYTQAEIVRSLQRIEKSQEALTALVTSQGTTYVTRVEFDLVRTAQAKEIREAKEATAAVQAATESRRPSGWTIAVGLAAIITSAVALVLLLAK